jgi:uncharacterized membrane protein
LFLCVYDRLKIRFIPFSYLLRFSSLRHPVLFLFLFGLFYYFYMFICLFIFVCFVFVLLFVVFFSLLVNLLFFSTCKNKTGCLREENLSKYEKCIKFNRGTENAMTNRKKGKKTNTTQKTKNLLFFLASW